MSSMNWTCTTCGRHVTLGDRDVSTGEVEFHTHTAELDKEAFRISYTLKRCPNPDCQANDLIVSAAIAELSNDSRGNLRIGGSKGPAGIGTFKFLPTTPAPLSTHVPSQVVEDYQEAYLICDLSPKASATLARRALQGMIRDFWGISKSRLHDELTAIEDKCDPDLYAALMAVKSVGNIGAHPERDTSLIVDIEPGEPQQLLDVIHLLDSDWYLARATREARIARMKGLGAAKDAAKEAGPKPS